jgi:hypothetical protein
MHASTGLHACVLPPGFGKVYRAMVYLTPVAIKVLDHEGLQGLCEFHNEMRLLCSIRHPNVVRLLGYSAEGQTQCLVYELMAGGNLEESLAHKVGRRGAPSERDCRDRKQNACHTPYSSCRPLSEPGAPLYPNRRSHYRAGTRQRSPGPRACASRPRWPTHSPTSTPGASSTVTSSK